MLGVEWYNREAVFQRDREFFLNGWFDPQSDAPAVSANARAISPGNEPFPAGSGGGRRVVRGALRRFVPGAESLRRRARFRTRARSTSTRTARRSSSRARATTAARSLSSNFNGDGFSGVRLPAERQPGPGVQRGARVDTCSSGARCSAARPSTSTTTSPRSRRRTTATSRSRRAAATRPRSRCGRRRCRTTATARCRRACSSCSSRAIRPTRTAPARSRRVRPVRQQPSLDPVPRARFPRRPEPTLTTTDVYQLMAGVQGAFTNRDWTWEAYVLDRRNQRLNVNLQHAVAAALSVPRGAAELRRRARSRAAATTRSRARRACRCSRTDRSRRRTASKPSSREPSRRRWTSRRTSSKRTCRARSPT